MIEMLCNKKGIGMPLHPCTDGCRFDDVFRSAEYWKAEHLAGNKIISDLIEAMKHIEGVAMADEPRDLAGIAETAREAIANALGHNVL